MWKLRLAIFFISAPAALSAQRAPTDTIPSLDTIPRATFSLKSADYPAEPFKWKLDKLVKLELDPEEHILI